MRGAPSAFTACPKNVIMLRGVRARSVLWKLQPAGTRVSLRYVYPIPGEVLGGAVGDDGRRLVDREVLRRRRVDCDAGGGKGRHVGVNERTDAVSAEVRLRLGGDWRRGGVGRPRATVPGCIGTAHVQRSSRRLAGAASKRSRIGALSHSALSGPVWHRVELCIPKRTAFELVSCSFSRVFGVNASTSAHPSLTQSNGNAPHDVDTFVKSRVVVEGSTGQVWAAVDTAAAASTASSNAEVAWRAMVACCAFAASADGVWQGSKMRGCNELEKGLEMGNK